MRVGNTELIDAFEKLFENYYDEEIKQLAQRYPNEQRSLNVDWRDIYRFSPDLAEDFLTQPEQIQRYAEEALRLYDLSVDATLGRANVRICNLPETEQPRIGEIRSRHMNRLIEITGTVDSISPIESTIEEAAFECQLCGTLTRIPQSSSDLQEPYECQGCERDGPFRVNQDQSEFVDTQTIYLEQRPAGVNTDEDREIIVVELEDDLVGTVVPGNTTHISGIVRRDDQIQDSKSSLPDKYLEGMAISKAQQYQLEVTDSDKRQIVQLSEDKAIYEKMAASLAPTVYGHEMEKLALILQLFSGVTKRLPDDTRIRGDIHIGIVGDPGVAKSQLARYAARISPRSVLVSGTTTSQVGLTAAATRTSGSNNSWTFEAGALPKADGGLACVDNITDLRSEELRALHDILEEQVVEASKGSSTVSIPARASLLAIGNPKYGRFDPYEPIDEQLDLEPGLLSQFDLLFVITDTPRQERDENVAERVLQSNYAGQLNKQQSETNIWDQEEEYIESELEEVSPKIDPELLQKYIGYARRNCHPRITDEAREVIKEFYVDLRSNGVDEDRTVPLSARKLEALVRLSEASARVRLSDTIEPDDAERAISLVRSCLQDLGIDPETGDPDANRVEGSSSKEKQEELVSLITNLDKEYDDGVPVDVVLDQAEKIIGMHPSEIEHEIDKLKQKGEVYEPNTHKLRTT